MAQALKEQTSDKEKEAPERLLEEVLRSPPPAPTEKELAPPPKGARMWNVEEHLQLEEARTELRHLEHARSFAAKTAQGKTNACTQEEWRCYRMFMRANFLNESSSPDATDGGILLMFDQLIAVLEDALKETDPKPPPAIFSIVLLDTFGWSLQHPVFRVSAS